LQGVRDQVSSAAAQHFKGQISFESSHAGSFITRRPLWTQHLVLSAKYTQQDQIIHQIKNFFKPKLKFPEKEPPIWPLEKINIGKKGNLLAKF